MGRIRVFIDFGSTFTKAAAFDMDSQMLISRVQTPSTVDTNVMTGLNMAMEELSKTVSLSEGDIRNAVACSSAAGGLKMVCIGLVPEYTTKAGNLAALGAGARVAGTYSYELTRADGDEIGQLSPDIVLLTGGTDGGNRKVIVHNAGVLAGIASVKNIIVAGNRSAHDEIADVLLKTGKNVIFTKNVMPEFGQLELESVNMEIRKLFISRITGAKGIAEVENLIGRVIMPTPSAVLEAAKLLSQGIPGYYNGFGDLLLVDVGGATTDVYSVASGIPTRAGVTMIGLREPHAKRTVEGDIGLYHNIDTLAELTEYHEAESQKAATCELKENFSVPKRESGKRYQLALARTAAKTAVNRHAGRCKSILTGAGEIWVQQGKDLSDVKLVIGSGGPVVFSQSPRWVLEGAVASPGEEDILKPKKPQLAIDEKYILYAIGLMSQTEPEKALTIAKKYLKKI